MAGQGFFSDKILQSEFHGMIIGVPWFSKINERAEEFAKNAQKTFGQNTDLSNANSYEAKNVSWVTANSYDTVQEVMMAIALSTQEDLSDISEQLKKLNETILPIKYTSGKEIKFPEKNSNNKQESKIFLVRVASHKECNELPGSCGDREVNNHTFQLIDKQ